MRRMRGNLVRGLACLCLLLLAVSCLFSCREEPIVYTVTFLQEGEEPVCREVEAGAALTELPTPVAVAGYTVAWESVDFSAVTGDVTVNAVLTPIVYRITYFAGEGTAVESGTYTVESAVTLPTSTRAGYTFGGWCEDAALSGAATTALAKGTTGDKTFYAKWVANENTLAFHGNGATGGEMADVKLHTDEATSLPACAFTRTGYVFVGWSKSADGAALFADGAAFTMTGDATLTLYAVWAPNENTLTFNGNGATGGSMENMPLHTDENTTLPACGFGKTGYTFIGWATSPEGEAVYLDGAAFTMTSDATVTLYAVWAPNENTLIFNGNGATGGSMENMPLHTDENTTLPACGFGKTGYTFIGWATSPEGEAVYADGAAFTMTGDEAMTLYAVWEIETYQITYYLNGGQNTGEVTTSFTVLDLPLSLPTPTKGDAIFGGWCEGADFTGYVPCITEARNYTLYAPWGNLLFEAGKIIGYTGVLVSLDIPTHNDVFEVDEIRDGVFKDCTTLVRVTIPDSVRAFGVNVFAGCPCVETIDGVQYVDTWVVGYTDEIEPITTLREGTRGMADESFKGCKTVLKVVFPEEMQYVETFAFNGCERLIEIRHLGGRFIVCNASGSKYIYSEETPTLVERDGEYYYYVAEGQVPAMAFYAGDAKNLVLPQNYKGAAYDLHKLCFAYMDELLSVEIPEGAVVKIGQYAFNSCVNLTTVLLPDSITDIGTGAFGDCQKLKDVALPNIKKIEKSVFSGCLSLLRMVIPASVTSIEEGAFSDCYHLAEVYNLSSLTLTPGSSDNGEVAKYAKAVHISLDAQSILEITENGLVFAGAETGNYLITYIGSLPDVVLPDTYRGGSYQIVTYAFYNNKILKNITSSPGVSGIGDRAFEGTDIARSYGGVLYIDKWVVGTDPDVRLTKVTVREGTLGIANRAFEGVKSLTEVVMPDSVTWIGDYAFSYCFHLLRVFLSPNIVSAGYRVFYECYTTVELYNLTNPSAFSNTSYPSSLVKVHSDAEGESVMDIVDGFAFLISGDVPELLGYVGDESDLVFPATYKGQLYKIYPHAFYNNLWIRSVTLPDKLAGIGIDAFALSGVETVVVGEGITALSEAMFSYCHGLKNITLPAGLVSIGKDVFSNCGSLETLVIPLGVTSVGARAVYSCDNLTVYYEGQAIPATWNGEWNRSGRPVVLGHNNVTTNPTYDYVLSGGKVYITQYKGSDTDVVLPATVDGYPVASIATAFKGNLTLRSVEVPSGILAIAAGAFEGCKGLVRVKLCEGVVSIGEKAFYNCEALEEISFPSTLRQIGSLAFYRCLALTEVVLPEGITRIEDQTFEICKALISVKLPSTLEYIGKRAFDSCSALTEIVIPIGVTTVGDYAFRWCTKLTIKCEVAKKPGGWAYEWNSSIRPVTWGVSEG